MEWERAKRLVMLRAYGPTGMCEGCGKWGFPLDPHHRQARGAGGVHGAAADTANDVRNILALCRSCHDETEHAETWDLTQSIGWRMPKWIERPADVPALLHTVNGYGWQFLTSDVGYLWMDPANPTPVRGLSWTAMPEDPMTLIASPGTVSASRLRLSFVGPDGSGST